MTRFPMVVVMAIVPLLAEVRVAQAEEPAYGPRVRLTAPSFAPRRLIGMVVGLDETMLTLQPQGSEHSLQIPRSAITKIEASRHRSRRGRGATIGAFVGLGAAVALGLAVGETCDLPSRSDEFAFDFHSICYRKSEIAAGMAILTVPAGALLGLAAGPGEKWEVSTTDRLRVTVGAGRGGGMRAALAIRF
jgi:hypothetical protein